MPHAIWKGDITFGLVNIPVALYTAESHQCDVKFRLLDKRDLSPIGYQKINKNTGKTVPYDQIVEGYEYEENKYVLLSKEEIRKIHPTSEQTIEILEFVDGKDLLLEYFEKPYFLEPIKKGTRGYALLREALKNSGKVGIAKVVIRTRQYLAALVAEDKALMLEILRFPCELINQKKFNLPQESAKQLGIQQKEIKIAEQLIKNMSSKWNPSKYKNEYQGTLLDYVMDKIKLGEAYEAKTEEAKPAEKGGKVIDLVALLKKSVEQSKKPQKKSARK